MSPLQAERERRIRKKRPIQRQGLAGTPPQCGPGMKPMLVPQPGPVGQPYVWMCMPDGGPMPIESNPARNPVSVVGGSASVGGSGATQSGVSSSPSSQQQSYYYANGWWNYPYNWWGWPMGYGYVAPYTPYQYPYYTAWQWPYAYEAATPGWPAGYPYTPSWPWYWPTQPTYYTARVIT